MSNLSASIASMILSERQNKACKDIKEDVLNAVLFNKSNAKEKIFINDESSNDGQYFQVAKKSKGSYEDVIFKLEGCTRSAADFAVVPVHIPSACSSYKPSVDRYKIRITLREEA